MSKKINEVLNTLKINNVVELLRELDLDQLQEIANSERGIFYKKSELAEIEEAFLKNFESYEYNSGDPFSFNSSFDSRNNFSSQETDKQKLIEKIILDSVKTKLEKNCNPKKNNEYTKKHHKRDGNGNSQVLGVHGGTINSHGIEVC